MNKPRTRKIVMAVAAAVCFFAAAFALFRILGAEKETEAASAEYNAVVAEYASPDFSTENAAEGGIRLVGRDRDGRVSVAGIDYDVTEKDEVEEAKKESAPFTPAPEPHPDHDALLLQNPDYVCWIWIPGTPVSYPVVSRDDMYYTDHTFLGTKSAVGAVFIGQSSDTVTYIYGHNMHDLSMFGSLRRAGGMEDVKEVHLIYPSGDRVYQIASSHITMVGGSAYDQPGSSSELTGFVSSQAKESSRKYTGYPEKPQDVIVLSTCFGVHGGTGRYVMVCVR